MFAPKPLVSEISVFSPPKKSNPISNGKDTKMSESKISNDNGQKIPQNSAYGTNKSEEKRQLSTKAVTPKVAFLTKATVPPAKVVAKKPPIAITDATVFPKKSTEKENMAELREQINRQNSDIDELKKLIYQISNCSAKSPDNSSNACLPTKNVKSDETQNLILPADVKSQILRPNIERTFSDAAVQTEKYSFVCENCQNSTAAVKSSKVDKPKKRTPVSENLKKAMQIKKRDSPNLLSDIDFSESIKIDPEELSGLDSPKFTEFPNPSKNEFFAERMPSVTENDPIIDRLLGATQKFLQPKKQKLTPKKSKPKVEENSSGLSLHMNSLAMHYLSDDRLSELAYVQSPARPLTLAKRKTVTMESQVSLINVPYYAPCVQPSAREFLQRYDHDNGESARYNNYQSYQYASSGRRYNGASDIQNDFSINNRYDSDCLSTITEKSGESFTEHTTCNNQCNCCTQNDNYGANKRVIRGRNNY